MSTSHTSSIVLKQDQLGRVQTPKHRIEELVAEFQQSNLSAKAFALLVGVRYHTFWNWLKERGLTGTRSQRKPTVSVALPARLVEVSLAQPPASWLEVVLPGGVSLRMEHEAQASLIVALLKTLS
jgi:hypothetical protein